MNSKNNVTDNGELLNTFNENMSKRVPIQAALTRPLVEVVGKCFLLLSGSTEMIPESNESDNMIPRAVYQVRIIDKNTQLSIGTVLTIKIKNSRSIINEQQNQALLLGQEKNKVVAFDDLSHWYFNNAEGLSASNIRILDLTPQDAMKL
ncbi:hypothetical protein L2302_08990 [Lactobacillus gasseri]|jgi:hypothetical protein|uniref:hypothetical protein n=1 Tax=Lactobacillus gasseri TaxID=1596 RepID=UPI00076436EF|nr:hypothetical protein [Lactobacillus gasseri]KXA23363.1 hypothetical protein HMPREF3210_01791 [Lactobacillus gasseri]MCZ3851811.1 hypothetical protein [Lactobacillus gasseri]MCZ3853650.1 hypothetical protein [Lactobacillus gasseri]MCZ3862285.1 hypothetical protein [Lactobacillus gasseri]MCZ3894882.1 hypothetical protein [Lactobacillus gasseri]